MHHDYKDIRSLIPMEPVWFDEHAVPRYAPFAVGQQADIYADEVVLLEIACQNCRQHFKVAMSSNWTMNAIYQRATLAAQVADKKIHYGDPPNMECCPAGPTMNCIDLRVLEFWSRNPKDRFEWMRRADLETEIESLDDY